MTLRPLQALDFLAGGRVPELERFIKTCRGHLFAIRAEGDAVNRLRMPFERDGDAGGQTSLVSRKYPEGQDASQQARER